MNRIGRSGSLRLPLEQDIHADNSPPRTPPSQSPSYNIPSKRGLHPRPSLRETFLDDFNPTDNMNNSSNESSDERDPHDLSLSAKHAARTSVVDNMLLSLDQFALSSGPSILDDYRLFNSVFESDTYRRDSEDSMAEPRYRGHTFSSSLSSEADFGYGDGTARYGAQPPSSRRSNGSTSYHSSLKRIGSSREGPGTRPALYDFRANTGSGSATHAVRKGSKGSGSSNLDFGPPLIRGRGDSTNERRSVSLDYGTRQPFVPFAETTSDYDPLSYDEFDAAPTPSVPAGPRKFQSSSQNDYSRTLNPQTSRTPVASRRNSIRSARTSNTKKSRPDNIGTGTMMRGRDNDLTNLGEDDIDPPPAMPASLDPPAPSPTVSFNKPTFPTPPDPIPTKERPGFFRRVFGSSKNSSPGPSENNQPELALSQENDHKDANAAGRRQPLRNNASGTNTTRQGPPQVVNKKPSFFRRRKKSVSLVDNVPMPIALPQELGPKAMEILKAEPSPVSSLSQAITSYLDDSVTQADDQASEFTNRGVGADDAENKNTEPLLVQTQKGGVPSAADGGLKSKSKLHNLPSSGSSHDTSFFINSSGDDDSTAKSGDLETSSSADPRQGQMAVSDDIQSRDSEKTGQIVGASQSLIAAQDIGSFSPLSPVIEGFPQRSEAHIEHSGATEPEDPTKSVQSPRLFKDNQIQPSKLSIPVAGANESPQVSPSEASNYYTAASTPALPSEDPKTPEMTESIAESSDIVPTDGPSSSDREQAKKLFDSQEEFVGNEPACAWLGDPDRAKIREAYMGHFDWPNMNILAALRSLCNRLVLKGETQQVDRVLDAFSTRWCQCNPRHGFKAADVVHTICYSLLLLNTDLHLADIEQKMTKNQFVRNTIPTIRRVAMDAAPGGFETVRSANQLKSSTQDSTSLRSPGLDDPNRSNDRPSNPPAKLVNRLSRTDLSMRLTGDFEGDIGLLVTAPFYGTMRAWEQHVETVLREFYSSIQKQRLPLHGAPTEKDGPRGSNNLLAPGPTHGLRRSPSTISKSGSDIYPRGRSADSRYGTARWSSKPRSRARLYPTSTMASSRTSLDDQSSLWSPSGSSTWSKYSLGKFTSASVESFGSEYPRGDYQQAIGFANALSQAIIREDSAHSIASSEDPERNTQLLEDETLQLAGAPWAKEGSLQHKHHLDSVDKRSKDRNWNECFAVIQQGWMRLFSFNNSTRSVRQKAKQRGGVVVGGGNWTENAEEIWKFLLRQTIASALPSPGYSKSRPHVWALSLPTGAVHLFHAGTPEIVREFVSTANYWSARLSKEPLIGGISNMEYGWSDAVINSALINSDKNRDKNRTPPPSSNPRSSIQSSIRSSLDQQVVSVRPKLPADRVHLGDWAPPQQSMVASALAEADQLKALQTYVKNVEDELQRHNELRSAMVLAFSPRHPNAMKAMANWERKSSYLLREIVKFRTYIDSLQGAIRAKNKIYASHEDDNSSS